ncbi:carbohydrate-binding protein [Chitinimonas koreensis]|uniref:carbohydrate-binding protein n=1 Tax=Chitinimonas koreensis TaxID=356302 RepID=UPI003571223D
MPNCKEWRGRISSLISPLYFHRTRAMEIQRMRIPCKPARRFSLSAVTVGLAAAGLLYTPSALAAACATAWVENNTYYAINTVVSYQGSNYKALVSHTAYTGTGWYPATTPSLWSSQGTCGTTTRRRRRPRRRPRRRRRPPLRPRRPRRLPRRRRPRGRARPRRPR